MFRPLGFVSCSTVCCCVQWIPSALSLLVFCSLLVMPRNSQAQKDNSFIVVDVNYQKILAEHDADEKRPVASLTKIATAVVALDWIDATGGDKKAMMIVPGSAGTMGGANPLGMQPGDRISFRDALYASLLASDNVSAETIADYIGWQIIRQNGGRNSIETFINQMNALAENLEMDRTKFKNPHGLDHNDRVGHSTARDLAKLTIYALNNTQFNFICSQLERDIAYERAGKRLAFKIRNTNQLLGKDGVDGVKTGRTRRAGDCLITAARKKDRFVPLDGNRQRRIAYRIVTVTLNSPDRFGQSAQLIAQGWNHYEGWLASGMIINDREELLTITEDQR